MGRQNVLVGGLLCALSGACSGLPDDAPGGELDGDRSPATIRQALDVPDDPRLDEQWGMRNFGQEVPWFSTNSDGEEVSTPVAGLPGADINMLKAWEVTQGSSAVRVGVIETADVDVEHEDLRGNIFENTAEVPGDGRDNDRNGCVDDVRGCDFSNDDGIGDPGEHATHVSGIFVGRINNGRGVAGVAPKVKLVPMTAEANDDTILEAIAYARRLGLKVINVSQGGTDGEGYMLPAVSRAMQNSGILFACSADNRHSPRYNFPSSFDIPNIISVANLSNLGELSDTSNFGNYHVDIAAPGRSILSTVPGNEYDYESGTSMAAPHVAGVAALLMNKFPSLSVTQVVDRILRTGMRMSSLTGFVKSGAVLDAHAALTDVSPIQLVARTEPGRIILTWNAQSGASRYEVERDGVVVNNGSSRQHVHGGLALDSPHIYRVRAIVGGNAGLWSYRWFATASQAPTSEALNIQTPHPYPDNFGPPPFVITKRNATRLRVHFSRIETLPGDRIEYLLQIPGRDSLVDEVIEGTYPIGFWTQWDEKVEFTFSSDESGRAFGFAIDRIEYFLGIPGQPAAPELFELLPGSVNFGVDATPGAVEIRVYRATAASGPYARIATLPADASDFTDSGLVRNRRYFYKVSSANDLGESPLSDFLEIRAL